MSRGGFSGSSFSEVESEIAMGVAPGADVGPCTGRNELRSTSDTLDNVRVMGGIV